MEPNPYESPRTSSSPSTEQKALSITPAGRLLQFLVPAICGGIGLLIVLRFELRPYWLFGMIVGGVGGYFGGLLNQMLRYVFRS